MKKLARISLALYVTALFAPLAHEVFVEALEERACERCEALCRAGPVLEGTCDESRPCENPNHHHHRHHVHGQCPACEHAVQAGLPLSRSATEAMVEAIARATPPRDSVPARRHELCHKLARAPPTIS